MIQYHQALQHILDNGIETTDRTGTGTIATFGLQMRFNLADGFPLVTTKKVHLKSIIHELLWLIDGDTNIKYLNDNGVTIWDEWADENGNLGPVYGAQWRDWQGPSAGSIINVDQISDLIAQIAHKPDSRRLIVTAWQPSEIHMMALPPCHMMWQVKILGGKLHLQLYQRSADMFLGIPFNIASYAMLTMMLAQVTGYEAGEFIHTIGDAHIYRNHVDQVRLQLSREPRDLPRMYLNPDVKSIFDFKFEDFTLANYHPYDAIKAPVSV